MFFLKLLEVSFAVFQIRDQVIEFRADDDSFPYH